MQGFWPAAILVPPSADLDSENKPVKEASKLTCVVLACAAPTEWSRDTVKMQGYELATLFVAPSDFQSFCERDLRKLVVVFCALIEVATGPCKNAGIRAGGHFGGSL